MTSFDWKALVKTIAPTLGTALVGPLGGMAGLALAKVLGVPDESAHDDTALAAAVQGATPDQLLALKKADNDFKLQMQELGFKDLEALEAIAAGDRASARDRETKVGDWTPRLLAGGVTLGFFGLLSFMLRREVPAGSTDVLNVMVGSLGTAWISIISYYFGSSASSARKTEIMGGK